MKKLLFVNPGPFGSLTDTYFYFQILKDNYDINYIGFNEDKGHPTYEKLNIIYLPGYGNNLKQKYLFYNRTKELIETAHFDFILINYFVGCSFIKMMTRGNIVLDIRSGYIAKSRNKRLFYNFILYVESLFFKKITIISESLRSYLNISKKKAYYLPLGASKIPFINKTFNEFSILYVGTFHERNIINTIYAFAEFLSEREEKRKFKYTIIGYGSITEERQISDTIFQLEMGKYINYVGVVRYPELITYLKKHNVGMAYIPITPFFNNQPPTKTFEYLLSGMAVIATGTKENKKVINQSNGVIIGDSIDEIKNGLHYIYENRASFNSIEIQRHSQKYCWTNIVKENLIPLIEGF